MKRWRGPLLRAAGVLLALAAGGCADLLDIPDDPALVATGPWRCLGAAAAPAPVAVAPQAEVRVQACDFIADCKTTVSGLTAKLCEKRDVGCNMPRLSGISDVNGELRFSVPTAGGGFGGYLLVDSRAAPCTDAAAFGAVAGKTLCDLVAPTCDLAAPDERCVAKVFAPAMLFFNPPIARDVELPVPLQMFPTSGLPAVLSAAGIAIDPAAGNLFVQALDCDGRPAAGVRFELRQPGAAARSLYVDNGIVSSSATQTDATGVGGFVGVPPGFVSVAGRTEDGVSIGEIGVLAAPSMLTYSALAPSVR